MPEVTRNWGLLCSRARKTGDLLEQVEGSIDHQPLEAARVLLGLLANLRLADESANRIRSSLEESSSVKRLAKVVRKELAGLRQRTRVLTKTYCCRT